MAEIKECVSIVKNAIEDKKGSDIKILNISKLSPLADYFVLATGSSQMPRGDLLWDWRA